MAAKVVYRPGMTVPRSGQYEKVGPRGGRTGHEVTVVKGEPFPLTSEPGQVYVLADKIKDKK